MKKTTSFFGNRFQTALRGFRSRRSRQLALSPAAAPEFEMLESRILLSGLTDGTKVLKSYNFIDADGDKVSIKVTGKLAKGAGFQVTDLGKGFDVDEINLVGLTAKNSLVVSVTPTRLAAADRVTSNQIWTPGFTNIGSITADTQTDARDAQVLGALGLRNLGLNAVIVGNIDLPEVDIKGGISLGVGKVAFVDRINTSSVAVPGFDVSYNPNVGNINLYDVTANSIGRITVNGVVAAALNNANTYAGYTPTNDIIGSINVTNDLGGISALRGTLNADVTVGGNLGLINVAEITGSISVGGDLTIRLPQGFNGAIVAGGHIHLGWQGGLDISNANITAGEGISGLLNTGTNAFTDTIFVPAAYEGTLTNTSDLLEAGKGIANITVSGVVDGGTGFTINSGNSVGNITGASFSDAMLVVSGEGGIGNLSATSGDLAGVFISGGDIGNLSSVGGSVGGAFTALGDIGNITVSNLLGDGIIGNFTAGGQIGDITAKILTPDGGSAIDANFTAGTTIGTITANSASTTGDSTVAGTINAGAGIGAIVVNSASAGAALSATINADTNNDGTGDIASITVISKGEGDGIGSGGGIRGANIGDITVTMTNVNAGAAITGTTFTASAKVEDGIGTGLFNNFGTIGNILVTNASANASGIFDSTFNAGGAGAIGTITVATAGEDAALDEVTFNATNGPGATEALQTSTIGALTVTNTGTGLGLDDVELFANDGVGAITVNTAGSGINDLTVNADEDGDDVGDVGAITVTTTAVNSFGWDDGKISGANVGDITVTINSTQGGFGMVGVDVTASAGDIGAITVTNKSEADDAWGIGLSNFTAEGVYDEDTETFISGGNIGQITVSTAGQGDDPVGSTGLYKADFNANGGSIAGVQVTTADDDGIVYSNFNAFENIGAIVVVAGDDGIENSSFKAGGNIASITVTAADDGIHEYSSFTAGGNIGPITVIAGEDGIEESTFTADGDIGDISVVATSEGISDSNFTAANIGTITIDVVASETEDDNAFAIGIEGPSTFTATGVYDEESKAFVGGTIGAITVNVTAAAEQGNAEAFGIYYNSFFSANESIGAVSVTAEASSETGGAEARGIVTGRDAYMGFQAGDSIGPVTVTASAVSEEGDATVYGIIYSEFDAGVDIGAVTVIASALSGEGNALANGIDYAGFNAGETIGAVNVTATGVSEDGAANAVGVYDVDMAATSSIGNITVAGDIVQLDLEVGKNGTIGNITGTGSGDQSFVATGLAGSSIGNITFASLGDGSQVDIELDGITKASNILINPADAKDSVGVGLVATSLVEVGNITVGGGLALDATNLVTIGNISVAGQLSLDNDLDSAETIGNFTIGSFAAIPAGGRVIGAGATAEIGFITIGEDLVPSGVDQYVFEFGSFNDVDDEDSDVVFAEVAGNDIVFDGTNPVDSTDEGIRFNLTAV